MSRGKKSSVRNFDSYSVSDLREPKILKQKIVIPADWMENENFCNELQEFYEKNKLDLVAVNWEAEGKIGSLKFKTKLKGRRLTEKYGLTTKKHAYSVFLKEVDKILTGIPMFPFQLISEVF